MLRSSFAYSHMENLKRFDGALIAGMAAVTNIRFGKKLLGSSSVA